MKIEMVVKNDENFTMSGVSIEDGQIELKSPEVYEPYVEEPPVYKSEPAAVPKPARFENYKETNSFDLFAGTSWAGTRQGPTDIGR
jgi:hypothetical protein